MFYVDSWKCGGKSLVMTIFGKLYDIILEQTY